MIRGLREEDPPCSAGMVGSGSFGVADLTRSGAGSRNGCAASLEEWMSCLRKQFRRKKKNGVGDLGCCDLAVHGGKSREEVSVQMGLKSWS